jgi:hypothetical protein
MLRMSFLLAGCFGSLFPASETYIISVGSSHAFVSLPLCGPTKLPGEQTSVDLAGKLFLFLERRASQPRQLIGLKPTPLFE